jgi:hypothetical protein
MENTRGRRSEPGPPWWSPVRLDRIDAIVNTVEFVVHVTPSPKT